MEKLQERDSAFRAKLKFLFSDKRPIKERVLLAVFPAFALTFTTLFFGPLDLYLSNRNILPYNFKEVFFASSLLFLIAFFVCTLMVLLIKGRALDIVISLLAAIAVAVYIQGNILNIDLGLLDGRSIAWQNYKLHMLLNLFIWAAILLAGVCLRYFFHAYWGKIIKFLSVLIVGMQLVALITAVLTMPAPTQEYVLSGEKVYEVSGEDNTIVIVLDAFPGHLVDDLLQIYPDTLKGFNDFTFFRNCSTPAIGTFPAFVSMFTGTIYDPYKPYADFFESAWTSQSTRGFYETMHDAGYSCKLFSTARTTSENHIEYLDGLFDNVILSSEENDFWFVAEKMCLLSAFRYAPHALKPSFWVDTGEFSKSIEQFNSPQTFESYSLLLQNGLSVQNSTKTFSIIHTNGAHSPFSSSRYAEFLPGGTDMFEHARGALFFVEEYLRMMQELGVYDNANIIITSDHGDYQTPNPDTLLMIKRSGETHASTLYNHAPVTTTDLIPTILDLNGLAYQSYGRSVYDYAEDEVRERMVYVWVNDPNYADLGKAYNAVHEYRFTGHVDEYNYVAYGAEYPEGITITEPDFIHPLKDSFY